VGPKTRLLALAVSKLLRAPNEVDEARVVTAVVAEVTLVVKAAIWLATWADGGWEGISPETVLPVENFICFFLACSFIYKLTE
jgi:hypothetical protein